MIRIDNVTKKFGRTNAVEGVSLDIASGDSVALWGVNGAGKSTLIRCVLGLLQFRGVIEVGGLSVHSKQSRRLIGYVPQELGFYDDLGVADAVLYFARLKGVAIGSPREVLADVGLSGHERKRIRELSGGMKQRLALAIALLGDPPVLILDEVTASLDACGRRDFVSLLSRLSGSGRTMLFASHRVEEVTTLAKKVVTLQRGRLVSSVPASAFVEHLGAPTVLHLAIKLAARGPAMTRLQECGFTPRLNGVGLWVPVPAEQKAAPFRVLAEANIAVEDFELVVDNPSMTGAKQGEVHP